MSRNRSYRDILRSSFLIGGASVANIVIGLLRTKIVAILLGPAGIGLIGLMQSVMMTASTVAAVGTGNVGTRQVAEAVGKDDSHAVAAARRALFWGTLVLAAIGGCVFWLLRHVLAAKVFDDDSLSTPIGWLAIGVAFTVASGSQRALLNGLRRISDIALISIASAVLSGVAGITALLVWGERAVPFFVLTAPLATFIAGHYFVAKLPKIEQAKTTILELSGQWKTLVRLGSAFMVAGLTITVGQLAVRVMVLHQLGVESLGYFQAAWVISMTYIGFVLQAMGADYYPRLTAVIRDHGEANRLVNEQCEVALLLSGPVFVALLGLAPWVIELLYSPQFSQATIVLRWQILGDILKVVSWPLGFIILAAGDGRAFMLTESLGIFSFVVFTWLGLPLVGIQATGIAFVIMYMVYLPTVYLLAKRRTGFRWQRDVLRQLAIVASAALAVFWSSYWSQALSATVGILFATLLGLHGIARLGRLANLEGRAGTLAERSRRILNKLGIRSE